VGVILLGKTIKIDEETYERINKIIDIDPVFKKKSQVVRAAIYFYHKEKQTKKWL